MAEKATTGTVVLQEKTVAFHVLTDPESTVERWNGGTVVL